MLVLIRGAGDIATGIAMRLWRTGVQVVMTDLPQPTAIRRTVCFSQAIVLGETQVEDATARRAVDVPQARRICAAGEISVLADPELRCREELRPDALVDAILPLKSLQIIGLHGYDGHIHDAELSVRCQGADAAYALTERVFREISRKFAYPLVKVMGGTPTFPMYAKRKDCECSPGTFVFWDWGYGNAYPDMPFKVAALLMTRAISVLDEHHVCVDLGYKAVASESPLPRVFFLNHPEAKPISQSEEHLVLEVPDSRLYPLGSVFYGIPVHICPTVALYDKAYVIRDREAIGEWPIIARSRRITY
jgi:hypothetical protein